VESEKPKGAPAEKGKPSRWKTLAHNGVAFPPAYSFRGFVVKLKAKEFKLNSTQEEMLWAIARKKGTPYLQDAVFIANFMSDFRKVLPTEFSALNFSEIDLSSIEKVQSEERAQREAITKEENKLIAAKKKTEKEALKNAYGWAEVDGNRVDRAGYVVEPAGLFMGRGAHPNRGKWKPQAKEEDIILNLGETAPIPAGKWKAIVHDHTST
jgi:DNA topoisomerase I